MKVKYATIEIDEMQQEILVMALGRFEHDIYEAENALKQPAPVKRKRGRPRKDDPKHAERIQPQSLALTSLYRMQEATAELVEQVMWPTIGEQKSETV